MFNKDKVKGHSRISKGKSGFKVIRVKDFFRKKLTLGNKKDEKDNKVRNIALGAGATAALGIGASLLLKKKRVKFPGELSKKPLLNKSKNPVTVINETIGTPPKQKSISEGKFIDEMDKEIESVVKPSTGKKHDFPELRDFWNTKNTSGTRMLENGDRLLKVPKRASGIRKKTGFSQVADPWSTPIKTPIKESTGKVIQETDNIKALPYAKPKPRENLLREKGNKSEDRVISRLVDGYATLPLPMKVTLQIEKALTRPIRTTTVGRPPDTKGLKTILDDSKVDLETVITKAEGKVARRLKRQSEKIAERDTNNVKKN
jgi:hypothetical protein